MTIVGAGGAATAIEIQAALDGVAEITIFNRKDEFWDRAVIHSREDQRKDILPCSSL